MGGEGPTRDRRRKGLRRSRVDERRKRLRRGGRLLEKGVERRSVWEVRNAGRIYGGGVSREGLTGGERHPVQKQS